MVALHEVDWLKFTKYLVREKTTEFSEDREERFQDSALRIARALNKGTMITCALVRRAVHQSFCDHFRRVRRDRRLPRTQHDLASVAGQTPEMKYQAVADLLRVLPKIEATVMQLRYLDGLTARETANEVGIAVSKVNRICNRATARLRRHFQRTEGA